MLIDEEATSHAADNLDSLVCFLKYKLFSLEHVAS